MKSVLPWQKMSRADLDLCIRMNRLSQSDLWRGAFRSISRLGDGIFWYALMLLLPIVNGSAAWPTVVRMLAAGLIGLTLYKWLKQKTSRPRPCEVYAAISAGTPPLDRFSFPSGHTLHAASLSIVCANGFPELASLVYPFALAVALSRPILGLHYPSDVLAGALLGVGVGQLVMLY